MDGILASLGCLLHPGEGELDVENATQLLHNLSATETFMIYCTLFMDSGHVEESQGLESAVERLGSATDDNYERIKDDVLTIVSDTLEFFGPYVSTPVLGSVLIHLSPTTGTGGKVRLKIARNVMANAFQHVAEPISNVIGDYLAGSAPAPYKAAEHCMPSLIFEVHKFDVDDEMLTPLLHRMMWRLAEGDVESRATMVRLVGELLGSAANNIAANNPVLLAAYLARMRTETVPGLQVLTMKYGLYRLLPRWHDEVWNEITRILGSGHPGETVVGKFARDHPGECPLHVSTSFAVPTCFMVSPPPLVRSFQQRRQMQERVEAKGVSHDSSLQYRLISPMLLL
jgi:hypothetical protein